MRSEIGNGALEPAKVSPGEVISITLWEAHGDNPDQISLVLGPDRTLYVRKYDVDRSHERSVLVTHTLDTKVLNEPFFNLLKTRLSVYRPEELSADGRTILPNGCEFIRHGQAIINVEFEDSKGKRGYFILQEGCVGPSAERIGADLKDILSRMPKLGGTDGFGWRGS